MAILWFILILGGNVLVHEFGHFIVAKWNNVIVLEFSLGMGPRFISWEKTSEGRIIMFLKSSAYLEEHPEYNGQTIYSWKLLPFGGSCMMLGVEHDIEDDSSYSRKSVYALMAFIFAGPFFNFKLLLIFSGILTAVMGYQSPQITVVADNTPAQKSGLQVGDVV